MPEDDPNRYVKTNWRRERRQRGQLDEEALRKIARKGSFVVVRSAILAA